MENINLGRTCQITKCFRNKKIGRSLRNVGNSIITQ